MKKSLIFSFSVIGQIGFATAIPLVLFSLLGRYLDRLFGTSPYLFLAGIVVATVLVYFILRQIVKQTIKAFEEITKKQ